MTEHAVRTREQSRPTTSTAPWPTSPINDYDAALAAGGRDNGKPGPRPYYH